MFPPGAVISGLIPNSLVGPHDVNFDIVISECSSPLLLILFIKIFSPLSAASINAFPSVFPTIITGILFQSATLIYSVIFSLSLIKIIPAAPASDKS